MAWQDAPCYSDFDICVLRVTALDDTGAPDFGTDVLYVADPPISLQRTPTTSERPEVNQRNGCGIVCGFRASETTPTGYTLTLELCEYEYGLLYLLLNGRQITDTGDLVGLWDPDPTDYNPNGVIFEAWTKPWDNGAQAVDAGSGTDDLIWRHHAFPKVVWTPGQTTQQEGINILQVVGTATVTNNVNLGPENDWPSVGNGSPYGNWLETDVPPEAECALQDLAS